MVFAQVWASFCPELRAEESQQRKAFNRVTKNKEFDSRDLADLWIYGMEVAKRAIDDYTQGSPKSAAPWAQAVRQNADRMLGVMTGFANVAMRAGQYSAALGVGANAQTERLLQ